MGNPVGPFLIIICLMNQPLMNPPWTYLFLSLLSKHHTEQPMQATDTMISSHQAFLYHPGRPVPITDPQATMVQTTMAQGKAGDESLHIWEQPLPREPAMADTGTYQNQGSTMSSMPGRGTMAGSVGFQQTPGSTNPRSPTSTWEGTNRYYDAEKGWIEVPQALWR